MQIVFIVPASIDTPDGGFFYARRIVAGLRGAGHSVEVSDISGADRQDRAVTALAAAASRGAHLLIDGLALPDFVGRGDALEAAGAMGFVHHPAAPADGASDAGRAAARNAALRLLPRLRRVIVASQTVAERLTTEFGVDAARIATVVPGTDDLARSTGSGGPGCAILSVGALIPRKGHDVLLRALARLFDLDWRLSIVGAATRDPDYARSLIALAEELGIAAQVRFTGAIDDAALESLWGSADLFALATQWEPYASAVAEALRRGLAVAVTSGGAAAALVPAEGGVVAPPGDVEQLSKAMRRLIFSAELRAEMAEVARQAGRSLPGWPTQISAFAAALES